MGDGEGSVRDMRKRDLLLFFISVFGFFFLRIIGFFFGLSLSEFKLDLLKK